MRFSKKSISIGLLFKLTPIQALYECRIARYRKILFAILSFCIYCPVVFTQTPQIEKLIGQSYGPHPLSNVDAKEVLSSDLSYWSGIDSLCFWLYTEIDPAHPFNDALFSGKKASKILNAYKKVKLARKTLDGQDFKATKIHLTEAESSINNLDDKHWRIKAQLYKTKSFTEFYIENYASALTDYLRCKEIKSGRKIDDFELAHDLNTAGLMYNGVDLPDSTESFQLKAMNLWLKNADSLHSRYLTYYTNYAYSILRQFDYERALPVYKRILGLLEEGKLESHYDKFFCYLDIGTINAALLKDDLAELYYKKAITYFSENINEVDRELLGAYETLIAYYLNRDMLQQASEYSEKMKSMALSAYTGENAGALGFALKSMAKIHVKNGECSKANQAIKQVKDLWKKEYAGKKTAKLASLSILEAECAIQQADYSLAYGLSNQAILEFDGVLNTKNPDLINARLAKIQSALLLGNLAHAKELLREFYATYNSTQNVLANSGLYNELAKLKLLQVKITAKEKTNLKLKYEKLHQQIDSDYYRAIISTGDRQSRIRITRAFKELYESCIKICVNQFADERDLFWLNQMLNHIEASKNLNFREQLILGNLKMLHDVPPNIIETKIQLEKRLLRISDLNNNESTEFSKSRNNLDFESELIKYEAFIAELKVEYPQYHKLLFSPPHVDFKNLIEFSKGEGLLLYHFLEDSLLRIFIHGETIEIGYLNAPLIRKSTSKFMKSLKDPSTVFSKQLANELHKCLFKGLKLQSQKNSIIGDEILSKLPFGSLQNESGRFLIEQLDLNYLNSVHSFGKSEKTQLLELVAFTPGFDAAMKERLPSSEKMNIFQKLNRQPAVADLTRNLSKSYKGKFLHGFDASDNELKEGVNKKSLLQIASHFEMDNQNPFKSTLFLAPTLSKETTGQVRLKEIMTIPLNAPLTILLACETGIGKYESGEGIQSLGRAFEYAGSERIITSLWKIDEHVSAQLISAFYENLQNTNSVSASLRASKMSFINHEETVYRHPYYWAGLTLFGNDVNVKIKKRNSWFMRWEILSGLILLMLIILFVGKRAGKSR